MSGITGAGPVYPSSYASASSSTAYPTQIDANSSASLRVANRFAPRPQATPDMSFLVDPGSLTVGNVQTDYGAWTTGTTSTSSATISSIGSVDGVTVGMVVVAYYYSAGVLTQACAENTIVTAVTAGAQGAASVTVSKNPTASVTGAFLIFCQPIGMSCTGTTTNGSASVTGLTTAYGFFPNMKFVGPGVSSGVISTVNYAAKSLTLTANAGTGAGTGTCTGTVPVPATNPRIDVVSVDSVTGVIDYTVGTAAATPTQPSFPINDYLLHQIYVLPTTTALTLQTNLKDKRTFDAPIGAYVGVNAQTGTTYTVAASDFAKLLTFTNAAAIAVTLPQAVAGGNFDQPFWFVASCLAGSTGAVTITPTTSTINGAATLVLQPGQSAGVLSDGTNYQTFGISGSGTFSGSVAFTGIITPTTLTGNTDNWNPTGLANAATVRASTNGGQYTLSGLAGGSSGREILLENIGSFPFVLAENSVSSSAGNRFYIGGASLKLLLPNSSVLLRYDATINYWIVVGATPLRNIARSGFVTFSIGTDVTFSHGLTVVPDKVTAQLKCVTANAGYSVNDVVYLTNGPAAGAASGGSTWGNTTTAGWSTANSIQVVTKGSAGTVTTITVADWQVQLLAEYY